MAAVPRVRALILTLLVATVCEAGSKVTVGSGGPGIALPYVEGTRYVKADGSSEIHLLFSELVPENVTLVDPFGNDDLSLAQWISAKGEVVVVKLSFTEGAQENYSMTLFLGEERASVGGHVSDGELRGAFRKLQIKGDSISGTLERNEQPGVLRGAFDTTLKTVREPQWITGPAVAKSPQGQVVLAYAAAMRKFDYAGASRHSLRDEVAETAKAKEMMGEKQMKKLIQEQFGTAKEFEKLLSSADASLGVSGNNAKVRLVRRDGSATETSTIGLVLVDGAWKVNW